MAGRVIILLLLAALSCFISTGLCEEHVYTFWPKEPDNSHFFDNAPAGQPTTNEAFWNLLSANARDYSLSSTRNYGSQGATWFWTGTLDTAVFQSKFNQLEVVSATSDIYQDNI